MARNPYRRSQSSRRDSGCSSAGGIGPCAAPVQRGCASIATTMNKGSTARVARRAIDGGSCCIQQPLIHPAVEHSEHRRGASARLPTLGSAVCVNVPKRAEIPKLSGIFQHFAPRVQHTRQLQDSTCRAATMAFQGRPVREIIRDRAVVLGICAMDKKVRRRRIPCAAVAPLSRR